MAEASELKLDPKAPERVVIGGRCMAGRSNVYLPLAS